jgi:4'-phosphopantetheinyl transferase
MQDAGAVELLVVRAPVGGDPRAAAHALLRAVLTQLTGTADHVLQRTCGTCGGPHGKPVLDHPSLHVSLSSAGNAAVVAVTAAGPVGVDVERVAATGFDGFPGVALGPDEPDGTTEDRARAWVRKEAVLKATGSGLAVDPRSVDVRPDRVLGAHLLDVPVPAGLACAVAVLCSDRPRLRVEERRLSP